MRFDMYQKGNFWFYNGSNKILKVASIKSTLPTSSINLIKETILNNQIFRNFRIWKKYDFKASIKLTETSIKIIVIE